MTVAERVRRLSANLLQDTSTALRPIQSLLDAQPPSPQDRQKRFRYG
jgi:hypothetical protein